MENFFEREGAHGAAAIPYLRIEADDKVTCACFDVAVSNRRIEFNQHPKTHAAAFTSSAPILTPHFRSKANN
jgi:hypothetical protein